MGIFNANPIQEYSVIDMEREPIESVLIESWINELNLYETLICNDFNIVANPKNINTINEASAKEILSNTIEYIKAQWNKLITLIKDIIAKIRNKISKDNKGIVDKNSSKNRESMKSKNVRRIGTPDENSAGSTDTSSVVSGESIMKNFKYEWREFKSRPDLVIDIGLISDITRSLSTEIRDIKGKIIKNTIKNEEYYNKSVQEILEEILQVPNADPSNLTESIMNKYFKKKEELVGISERKYDNIEKFLLSGNEQIKALEEVSKITTVYYKEILDIFDVAQRDASEYEAKALMSATSYVKKSQQAMSLYTGALLSIYKQRVIDSRSVYIKLTRELGGASVNEQTLIDMECSVLEYSIKEDFEGIYL